MLESKKIKQIQKDIDLTKQEHCLKCKATNKRFDAKLQGYSESQWFGTESYNGICLGCFWSDRVEFNERVTSQMRIKPHLLYQYYKFQY